MKGWTNVGSPTVEGDRILMGGLGSTPRCSETVGWREVGSSEERFRVKELE